MALILCPKCKVEISEFSNKCPACNAVIDPNSVLMAPTPVRLPAKPQPFFTTFFTIFPKPRKVFERILAEPRGEHTWTMLLIVALLGFLGDAMKDHKFFVNLVMIPIVMVIVWLTWKLMGWLFYHVGKWFDGKGTFPELFDQMVWSSAAGCVTKAIFILGLMDISDAWQFIWKVVGWVASIWAIIFNLILISAAHRFSVWKALAVFLIAVLIILSAVFLLFIIVMSALGRNWMELLSAVWRGF